jgi:hypothetical protein
LVFFLTIMSSFSCFFIPMIHSASSRGVKQQQSGLSSQHISYQQYFRETFVLNLKKRLHLFYTDSWKLLGIKLSKSQLKNQMWMRLTLQILVLIIRIMRSDNVRSGWNENMLFPVWEQFTVWEWRTDVSDCNVLISVEKHWFCRFFFSLHCLLFNWKCDLHFLQIYVIKAESRVHY